MIHEDWHDPILEGFIEDMKELGIELHSNNIQYSGFWSQGDGASFTVSSSSVDTEAFIKAMLSELPQHLKKYQKKINWDFNFTFDDYPDSGLDALSYSDWEALRPILNGKNEYLSASDAISLYVCRISHTYCHENTVHAEYDVDFFFDDDDKDDHILYRFAEAVYDAWSEFVTSACLILYEDLYKYYETLEEYEED